MIRRLLISLACIMVAISAAGQSTRVRGGVYDAETGEPLPFVGIYFDGTTIGITSDLDGRFSIETRSPDAKVLTAQLLGYEPLSIEINKGAFSEVNFHLMPDRRQLDAAVVKPDDRYIKSILRKLDRSLSKNDPDEGPSWTSRLYSKIEFDVTNMEDLLKIGVLDKNLGFVREYTDTSAITGKPFIPVMISENVSDVYHSENPSWIKEVMRTSRISGLEDDNAVRQFTGSYLLKTNFYKPGIGVFNLELPNPAAASSHMFYNYFLVDSLQVEGRKTYVLRFHPKSLVTSPTLDGEMQFDAEDFGIRSVHAQLSPSSNVNWIRHINFDIVNRRTPEGKWFYDEEHLFIDFSVTLSDKSKLISILANRNIKYQPPVFGPVTDKDALTSVESVIMRDVAVGDDAYWEDARPYKLTDREQGIYDMVEDFQGTGFYKGTYGIVRTLVNNYYEVKPWGFEFGRWARTFSYTQMEGFRVQIGGRTLKEWNNKIRLGGYVAYGFRDKIPKGEATVEWMLGREKTRKLTATATYDYKQYGSGTGVFTVPNIFSSILARNVGARRNIIRCFNLEYDHEFCRELNSKLGLTQTRIWGNEIVPFIRRSDNQFQNSFSTNEVHAQLRVSFNERVNRNFFKKTYLFTKYPVITLDVTGGIAGITKDDIGYLKTEAEITWKVPTTAVGFGKFMLQGGAIWGGVPYPLLKLHEGNQTFFLDKSAFSCMDYFEFASDRWLSGYYVHNFNGFFLGKIPLLKKLDLREVVTARFAWGTLSEANDREHSPFIFPEEMKIGTLETPYVELGVGISNILRILRVDAYWRVTHPRADGKNFTINVGLDVEF